MVLKQENISRKIILFSSALTCIYIPALFAILSYTNNLYKIGKYSSSFLLLALLLGELIKHAYAQMQPDLSTLEEIKSSKQKKAYKFKMRDIFKVLVMNVCCVYVYFFVIVLFGAPVLSEHEGTLMLAMLLTLLTILPSCLQNGVDGTLSLLLGSRAYGSDAVSQMLRQNMFLCLLGSWCAVPVIPLDWDRPWQVWPVPCCVGALLGHYASHAILLAKQIPCISRRMPNKNKMSH